MPLSREENSSRNQPSGDPRSALATGLGAETSAARGPWDEAEARLSASAAALLAAVREAIDVLEIADCYGLFAPGSLGDADVKDCRDQLRAAHRCATGFYFTPHEIRMGASEADAPAEGQS